MGLATKTLKGALKATIAIGGVSEKVITGIGKSTMKAADIGSKAGKAINNSAKAIGNKTGKHLTKELTEEALENATLYERMVGKKLTAGGVAALTVGTMAVSTGEAIADNGMSKFNKLGYTSVGDNLDRLVSYDGSGFVENINQVSNGDPEIMQDIVKNSFNNVNQFGASGDIVFALHNMREG